MTGRSEQAAGLVFFALYLVAAVLAAVLVAVLDLGLVARLAIFAVLFSAGLALWERRRRAER